MFGRFVGAGIVELAWGCFDQPGEELVDLVLVEADAVERIFGSEGVEELHQDLGIPLRQLGGPVERDRQRGGLDFVDVELDHVALLPAQRAHRLQPPVPPDHPPAAPLDDQRLGLPEAA